MGRLGSRGAERAWVHSKVVVMEGGGWADGAVRVIPAYYDPAIRHTIIRGDSIPFAEFVKNHAAAQ